MNYNCYKILKLQLNKAHIKLSDNENGREGVDFLIGENQLYLQSIDLDTIQRSIKINIGKEQSYF